MGLAYDLGRFAGIDDSEALSKMQDAISGNAAALADYGVKLDGATLKQTAQSMIVPATKTDKILDKLDDKCTTYAYNINDYRQKNTIQEITASKAVLPEKARLVSFPTPAMAEKSR